MDPRSTAVLRCAREGWLDEAVRSATWRSPTRCAASPASTWTPSTSTSPSPTTRRPRRCLAVSAEGLGLGRLHRDRTTRNDFIDAVIDGMIHGRRQRQAQVQATAVAEIDAAAEGAPAWTTPRSPGSKPSHWTPTERSHPHERNLSGVRRGGDRNGNLRASDPFSGRAPAAMGGASVRPCTLHHPEPAPHPPGHPAYDPMGDPEPAPDVDNRLTSDEVVAAAEGSDDPRCFTTSSRSTNARMARRGQAKRDLSSSLAALLPLLSRRPWLWFVGRPSPPDTGPMVRLVSPLASPHGQNEALRSSPTTLEVDDDR